MKSIRINPRVISALIWCMLACVTVLLSATRVFDDYELNLLDFRYKLRPEIKTLDKIVFIEISDDSIKKIGRWPFDRSYHTLLVKALEHAGAKQIIFDIFFSEEKKGDNSLAEAIKEAGNVYMPYVFSSGLDTSSGMAVATEYDAPLLEIFKNSCKATGHINIIPERDGKFRRIPPFIKYHGELKPQMSFLAACNYRGFSYNDISIKPGKYVSLKDQVRIPLDENSNIIVNFPGKWTDYFRHYSYVDIISSYMAYLDGMKGVVDLDELKDAVCFIGITATAAPDSHPSPYEPIYPGVGVHASLFNSIYFEKFISRVNKLTNILILGLLLMITGVIATKPSKFIGAALMAGLLCFFIVISILLFSFFGLWINVFYPSVVMVLFYLVMTFRKYIFEMQKREILENELSIAKTIQQSFLPTEDPQAPGIEVTAEMRTARQVGGDLYDFIELSENISGIMIGDVSGKGVPAALYMAKAVSEFKSHAKNRSASDTMTILNEKLIAGSTSSLFVTVAYMIFDTARMKFSYSIGGHNDILMLRRGEGKPRYMNLDEGMPLGIIDGPFAEKTDELKDGDLFILCTDGVTEALNQKNEMFEEERLERIVLQNRELPTKKLVSLIQNEVDLFEGKDHQHDDITVIAIRINKNEKN